MNEKKIFVSIDLRGETVPVGQLYFHVRAARRQSSTFEYDSRWLSNGQRFALEPALQLTEGAFHTQLQTALFGSVGDSAPDRWGQMLMLRAEASRAQAEMRAVRTLSEVDYLLGVNDEARVGALRFSLEEAGPYLAPKEEPKIPPLVDLPKLLSASDRYFQDEASYADLQMLLAPGSSLGGARPKASVREKDGSLAIAKFPKKDDEHNVVLWEAVALRLAEEAGITTAKWRIERILNKPLLIIQRFDRRWRAESAGSRAAASASARTNSAGQAGGQAAYERIPFLSAMSMLGARDNEPHSYREIAYALMQHGASPNADLEELWRRMVFSVLISNTDDHLRNHGFLYEDFTGWRLSPAYDINPVPLNMQHRTLSTYIDFDNPLASVDLALSVIADFRISARRAEQIVQELRAVLHNWRSVAAELGLTKKEIERMSAAFRVE